MWIVKLFYVYLNSFCELSLIIKTKSFANSEVKTKIFYRLESDTYSFERASFRHHLPMGNRWPIRARALFFLCSIFFLFPLLFSFQLFISIWWNTKAACLPVILWHLHWEGVFRCPCEQRGCASQSVTAEGQVYMERGGCHAKRLTLGSESSWALLFFSSFHVDSTSQTSRRYVCFNCWVFICQ